MQTACDRNGWILGYTVHPGNEHDSRTSKLLYEEIKGYAPEMVIMDAGYRTPAIAHELLTDGILPLLPYERPMTRDGFFKEYEYVYDEHYDCYICPEDQVLTYRTTDREGYREYKSCGEHCAHCPSLGACTHSKSHVKTVTRHVWEEYMEMVEDIRPTRGNKEIYARREETIERIFGTAKEQHGFRYTQYIGRARMEMKAGLTFACMDPKRLARILARKGRGRLPSKERPHILKKIYLKIKERCWSLTLTPHFVYSLRLANHKASVCLFIHNFMVLFDNSRAECNLRIIKGKTKVSGYFRTEEGARDYLKIMSYVGTAHKQGYNAYEAIKTQFQVILISSLNKGGFE